MNTSTLIGAAFVAPCALPEMFSAPGDVLFPPVGIIPSAIVATRRRATDRPLPFHLLHSTRESLAPVEVYTTALLAARRAFFAAAPQRQSRIFAITAERSDNLQQSRLPFTLPQFTTTLGCCTSEIRITGIALTSMRSFGAEGHARTIVRSATDDRCPQTPFLSPISRRNYASAKFS